MGKLANKNVWGGGGDYSLEAQRTDLWRLDLGEAVTKLGQLATRDSEAAARRQYFDGVTQLSQSRFPGGLGDSWYYARSVSFPEIRVASEVFRRHSTPSYMPGWDNAPTEFSVVFIHDTNDVPGNGQSSIVGLLEHWLRAVRSGRDGGRPLNEDFSADFSFNMVATLLVGYRPPSDDSVVFAEDYKFSKGVSQAMKSGLADGGGYVFRKAWLASYKVGDLTYDNSQILTVTANFNCQSISPRNEI